MLEGRCRLWHLLAFIDALRPCPKPLPSVGRLGVRSVAFEKASGIERAAMTEHTLQTACTEVIGVPRGAWRNSLFWYRPKGRKTYRVLYADLALRDSPNAPQVVGATRIEKASKNSVPPAAPSAAAW